MRVNRRVEAAIAGSVVVVAIAVAIAALVPSDERRTEVIQTSTASTTTTTAAAGTTVPPATTTTAPAAAAVPAAARVAPGRTPRSTTPRSTTTARPEPGWGHGLWVANVDGSDQRRLQDWAGGTAWSPDGTSLAVSATHTIRVISARDGHQQRVLAGGTDSWISCIDWSSSGDLAWLTHEGKVYVAPHPATAGRLVADNADGQGTESCAWSPDGRLLAVTGPAVSVYTAEGTLLQRWSRGKEGTAYGDVSWSGDGSRIAALEYDTSVTGWHLALFDPKTPAIDPVIASPDGRSIHSFAWHPDGSRLYVQASEGRDAAHFLVRVDDRTHTRLDGVCCRRLRPLRDGRFLAFAPAYGRENKQLVVVGPDFQVERVVARAAPPPEEPSMYACYGAYFLGAVVSPDGTQVAVDASGSYGPRCDSPVY